MLEALEFCVESLDVLFQLRESTQHRVRVSVGLVEIGVVDDVADLAELTFFVGNLFFDPRQLALLLLQGARPAFCLDAVDSGRQCRFRLRRFLRDGRRSARR